MAEIVAQLQELKTEVSAEQQAQQARDTELAQREESRRTALGALQRAEAALALGNTDIERELEEAESVLNPSANAALANVRQSLANDDLYSARQYLQQAIIAADSGSGISRTLSAGGHRHHGGR